jgi:hypothetical protein
MCSRPASNIADGVREDLVPAQEHFCPPLV